MANLQNNLLVEVEQELDFYLNKKGMTNKQALKEIEKKHGSFHKDLAQQLLDERNNHWVEFHKTNRSLQQGD
jgi:uncharacterized protein YbaP (TraB family)|tara:strand:- start:821 stop:1036 length:216 start_codon:yes stop_codon:yes gene_type:complete